jgi:diguanylate cyclase (GGDEF)-like protein
VTLVLFFLGVIGSFAIATSVARTNYRDTTLRQSEAKDQITTDLQLALQRQQDLVVNVKAFLLTNPNTTQAEFSRWIAASDIYARYPGIEGLAEVEYVPAADLPAFVARYDTGALGSGGSLSVTPSGARSYYCLISVTSSRPGEVATPAGLDFCTTVLGPALIDAADSGKGAVVPGKFTSATSLLIGTPIYAGGAVPTTVALRRSQLIGWVGTQIVPSVFLKDALLGHQGVKLVFRYSDGTSTATFSTGASSRGATSSVYELQNGWIVTVLSASPSEGILRDTGAILVLTVGIILSLLGSALVYILASGRDRARAMVKTKTEELARQALHDPLTGLPNRRLVTDRLRQMLAHSHREGTDMAVLFLDLDDFKEVNDTKGHLVGDLLLKAIADRLTAAIREGDTVGRFGGDEFVILLDGPAVSDGSSVVDRILDAFSEPFDLGPEMESVTMTASIGITTNPQLSIDELLEDADKALYRAKAEGRNRAVSSHGSGTYD